MGNGNDNGNGKIKKRSFGAKEIHDLCVVALYIIQRRGIATVQDVYNEITEKLESRVNIGTLTKAVKMLWKKKLLAVTTTTSEQGGHALQAYLVRELKFSPNMTEVAHVSHELIPTILADGVSLAIKALLDDNNKRQGPKGKGTYPSDFVEYTARYRLNSEWWGSQPLEGNPELMKEINDSPWPLPPDVTDARVFQRAGDKIMVHGDCVRGFFEKHLGMLGLPPTSINYFMFEPIFVAPKHVAVKLRPVLRAGEQQHGKGGASVGAGTCLYEVLPVGTEIEFTFAAPTKNFPPKEFIEMWLRRCLRLSVRSMSPARGGESGGGVLLELRATDPWEVWKKPTGDSLEEDGEEVQGGGGAEPDGAADDEEPTVVEQTV